MHSKQSQKKNLFPLIFSFILLLHLTSLILRLRIEESKKQTLPERKQPLVVKVLGDKKISRQIVQSSDSDNHEEKDGAFLSDKTRSFDRQTRAMNVDTFKDDAGGGGQNGGGGRAKKMKLSDLGASSNPFEEAAREYRDLKKNKTVKGSANPPGAKGHGRTVSSTNDYLEDIPLGDMTYLNTVEYKYYGFYHRIRQKLEQFWGRSIQEKAKELAKAGRHVASEDEFVTALLITLDAEGEIIEINIKGSSGVKELDDAAVESFNEAGPFPNPPKDLIVDGKVVLEWGFVVKS